jgi:menaquinone-specific isochorismate synthase
MRLQSTIELTDLDWDSFARRGHIQGEFGTDSLWLGYGPEASGEIKFFQFNFFQTDSSQTCPAYVVKTTKEDLLRSLSQHSLNKVHELIHNDDDCYLEDVRQIKNWIGNNEIQKLVAVTKESYHKPESFNPLAYLAKALDKLPGTLYGFWNETYGMMGITPEPLFLYQGNKGFTYALAGTISTNEEQYQQKLLNDPKELNEHQLVIDDLCQKLGPLVENVHIEPTEVLDYGNIAHLKTRLNFQLKPLVEVAELVKSLSPSAALGGYPTQLAWDYLKQTQHYTFMEDQRQFGGVVGLQNKDFKQALVAIRNLQWNQEELWIESGSGIVASSQVDKELKEVQKKRDAIKKALLL